MQYSQVEAGGSASCESSSSTASRRMKSNNNNKNKNKNKNKTSTHNNSDDASTFTTRSKSSKYRHQRVNSDLSEPLTSPSTIIPTDDEESGTTGGGFGDDPYFVFRDDLYKKLSLVDDGLAEFLRVVMETDTSVNVGEYKDVKKQLKRYIKNAEATLRDVQTTVQVVENERSKFPHIDNSQLYERKSLVHTSKERLSKAKEEMTTDRVKEKLLTDERNKAIRRSGDGLLGATNDGQRENSAFIFDSQAQTSLLMEQQDDTLDALGEAVTRVGRMAEGIHEEIGQQNKMLDEFEEDLDNAEEQLGLVMGKLAKFLHTKNKWQLGTIVALSCTAVVLLFLVLYT